MDLDLELAMASGSGSGNAIPGRTSATGAKQWPQDAQKCPLSISIKSRCGISVSLLLVVGQVASREQHRLSLAPGFAAHLWLSLSLFLAAIPALSGCTHSFDRLTSISMSVFIMANKHNWYHLTILIGPNSSDWIGSN